MSNYAKADAQAQWFATRYPGSKIDPNCGVLHTTEGTTWPTYSGGATAPNYTAKPDMKAKRMVWRAHFPDEMSSRALQNDPGGVETNTSNAVQVELVGTCAPAVRDMWTRKGLHPGVDFIYWPTAPEWALRDVAAFVADMATRHGIRIDGPKTWLPYPASYGQSNPNRMTFTQWRNFYGWCGHQHVPENDHGDPGSLAWERIAVLALGMNDHFVPPPRVPRRWRDFFHIPHGWAYWKGEGIEGADLAVKRGKKAIDRDALADREGVLWNLHWSRALRHGYRDPLGKIPRNRRVEDMTSEQVARLVAPDGRHPQKLVNVIAYDHGRGLRDEIELKGSPALGDKETWRPVGEAIRDLHAHAQVKTLTEHPGWAKRLRAVKATDPHRVTFMLPRRTLRHPSLRFPKWAAKYVDYVRGRVTWI